MRKRFTKLAVLFVLCLTLGLSAAVTTAFAESDTPAAVTYSAKTVVPDAVDFVNYYGGASDLSAEDGGGVYTFAHAGYTVPLEGKNIKMKTLFKLLSKKDTSEGGDGIDGWVTYSFSATPAEGSSDKTYPYHGGAKNGYFLHITNYSGTTAPNCVEVQVVQMLDGATTNINTFFLDNAINEPLTLSLAKAEDGTFTLAFIRYSDSAELKKVTELALDESLFINDQGQTFFSTAIYEASGCDEKHWEHRGIAIFTADVYTVDVANAVVTLETESYEFEEGNTYKPAVTVVIAGKTLEKDTDYVVEYADNKAVGTAKAVVSFIGNYTGNEKLEKTFTITEKTPEPTPGEDDKPGTGDQDEPGCGAAASAAMAAIFLAAATVVKRRG